MYKVQSKNVKGSIDYRIYNNKKYWARVQDYQEQTITAFEVALEGETAEQEGINFPRKEWYKLPSGV